MSSLGSNVQMLKFNKTLKKTINNYLKKKKTLSNLPINFVLFV